MKPRDTNPLDPEYKLPYKEPDPVFVHKFIRDTLNVDDIEARLRKLREPPAQRTTAQQQAATIHTQHKPLFECTKS